MAATCPHGRLAGECPICPPAAGADLARRSTGRFAAGGPPTAGSARPAPPAPPAGRHASGGAHVAVVVAAIVVVGLVAWAVAGVVFAILHVLELSAVALAAGWAGYRVGHYRGSRPQRS